MKKLIAAIVATTALVSPALAQEKIDEFRIGVLGGENAQDRMTSNECLREKTEDLLGVPTRIFTPADYDGVI
jgi:phosphonate transport system substrate-binding protein